MIEELKKAIEEKELDINLDDYQIMSKEDFTTMVEGYKGEIESTKSKSSKIGQEILLKELKKDIGLEYDNRKDPEALKKAYLEKFGKPESDNEDFEERFKLQGEKYTKELQDSNDRFETLKNSHKAESDNKTILESLRGEFSKFEDKTNYKTDDLVTIALSKNEFSVIDGKVFKSKDGEIIKDNLFQTVGPESFANSMMQDGYIKAVEGGRIVGDETKGGKYTMEQFIAAAESGGENINSLAFSEKLEGAVKSGIIEG